MHRDATPQVRCSAPAALTLACLVAGAATLLLGASPSYDVWSWTIWGREILHGGLDTAGGTAWKPLPVLFTTPFALAGSAAPTLWMAVARAAAFGAVALAFILARRLAGGGLLGAGAGIAAAAGVAVMPLFLRTATLGTSEPMLIALALGAADAHLRGRPRQAFAFAAAVSLLRPEAWPVFGAYGLWLAWRDRGARPLVFGLGAIVPLLWFGPQLAGSGTLIGSSARSSTPGPGSYAGIAQPVAAALRDAATQASPALLAGLALGIVLEWRRFAVLTAVAAAWIGVAIGTLAAGFAGNPRFFVGATALLIAAGAGGWAVALRRVARAAPAWWPPARWAGAAAALVLTVGFVSEATARMRALTPVMQRAQEQGVDDDALAAAIARAGGPRRILACGAPATEMYSIPMVAWYLRVPVTTPRERPRPGGSVLQTDDPGEGGWQPRRPRHDHLIAASGEWRVFLGRCRRSAHPWRHRRLHRA